MTTLESTTIEGRKEDFLTFFIFVILLLYFPKSYEYFRVFFIIITIPLGEKNAATTPPHKNKTNQTKTKLHWKTQRRCVFQKPIFLKKKFNQNSDNQTSLEVSELMTM